jgi:hypothetical protein
MGMLGTDDPVKGQLMKKSALHREQLEEEVRSISEQTEKMITNAVIIGGALAVTYFLVSRFSGSKSKKKSKAARIKLVQSSEKEPETIVHAEPSQPGVVSQIGTALVSQATVFLLGLAQEKLAEFLQAQSEKKAKANGAP